MAVASLLLAACATAGSGTEPGPAPSESRPVALRLAVTGVFEAVFGPAGPIPVEVTRAGAEAPIALAFQEGALAVHELPPGDYTVTRIGPLACTGIGFAVAPGSGTVALGTLRAEALQTDYDIALVSATRATSGELAELGGAETVPLFVHSQALCHAGRGGPGTEYRDLSPAEQVMVGILFAGFCAAAVATGGFCAF